MKNDNGIISIELFEKLYGADDFEVQLFRNAEQIDTIDVVSQGILCFSANTKEIAQKCKKRLKENAISIVTIYNPNQLLVEVKLECGNNITLVSRRDLCEHKALINALEFLVSKELF